MASFFKLEDEEFQSIPALETDGRNWQDYRAALDQVVAKVVSGILVFLIRIFLSWYQVLESFPFDSFYAIHIMKA